MFEKALKVIGSIRFWMLTFAAASVTAAYIEVHGFQVSYLLNAIGIWLGAVAGLGTLDSIALKSARGGVISQDKLS